MLPWRTPLDIACKVAVIAACGFGMESSWKIADADLQFRHDDADSIRAAIRVQPDAWPYYVRLSQLDDGHARELLQKALALDPFDAQADIELGLSAEAEGDLFSAEKYFKNAFAVDRTWLPRWSLANFYLRRGDLPEFWEWAARAAQMHPADAGLLFQICWRVEPAPETIDARILHGDPELTRQFLGFLLARDQVQAAAALASRQLLNAGTGPAAQTLFQLVDRLVSSGDGETADVLWHRMMTAGIVFTDRSVPYNGDFLRDPLPVFFDWSISDFNGVHSWTGQAGLVSELSGSQPEKCVIAQQMVVLQPGAYQFEYPFHTTGIPPRSGLRWQLLNAATGALLVQSADLSSEDSTPAMTSFEAPPGQLLYLLRLVYMRTPGSTRVAGTVTSMSIRVRPQSQQ